jgi:hypothetical protein
MNYRVNNDLNAVGQAPHLHRVMHADLFSEVRGRCSAASPSKKSNISTITSGDSPELTERCRDGEDHVGSDDASRDDPHGRNGPLDRLFTELGDMKPPAADRPFPTDPGRDAHAGQP